eukprot:363634-Chlamydomonas_euryale.AAC.19
MASASWDNSACRWVWRVESYLRGIADAFGCSFDARRRRPTCLQLTKERAEQLYMEHSGKEFYPQLVDFMTSGPVEALVLSKEAAVAEWRKLLGPTDNYRAIAPLRCGDPARAACV